MATQSCLEHLETGLAGEHLNLALVNELIVGPTELTVDPTLFM